MMKQIKAMKSALEALEGADRIDCDMRDAITALQEALADQPAQDNTYGYAKSLAEAIFKQHYASDEHYASGRIVWGVNDTVIGILTQIDNMVADMARGAKQPAQQEPGRNHWEDGDVFERISAIKEQPAQQSAEPVEPVAVVSGYYGGQCVILPTDPARIFNSNTALYTSPPVSKPLTDEEIWREYRFLWPFHPEEERKLASDILEFARAIEAAHGITNE